MVELPPKIELALRRDEMKQGKGIALVEAFDHHDEISAIMVASLMVVVGEAEPSVVIRASPESPVLVEELLATIELNGPTIVMSVSPVGMPGPH